MIVALLHRRNAFQFRSEWNLTDEVTIEVIERNRALAKILILVPLAVVACWFAIGPGGLVSYSPATRVGVHSVLAFWISIPAALVLLAYQRKPLRSNIMLLSALVFSIVLHIGSTATVSYTHLTLPTN